MNVILFGAVGLLVETQRIICLIRQHSRLEREFLFHIASFRLKFDPSKRMRFNSLISNIRALLFKYIENVTRPSKDCLLTS
jgi:hypothetical protein